MIWDDYVAVKATPGSIAAGVMLVVGCVVLLMMIGFSGKAPTLRYRKDWMTSMVLLGRE
jgi:hypothetical protein